jgi:hypothetical protein
MAHKIHPKKAPVEKQNELSRQAYEAEMDEYERYLHHLNKLNGIGVSPDDRIYEE